MRLTRIWTELIRVERGHSVPRCDQCIHPLDVHQPDPDRPDRLLGVCQSCGSWHVLDGRRERVLALIQFPEDQADEGIRN